MLTWITQYWMQVGFGLLCAAVAFIAKYFWSLLKKQRAQDQEELLKNLSQKLADEYTNKIAEVYQKSVDDDKKLQTQIDVMTDSLNCLKTGLLSVQGREFREECHMLLEEGHYITIEEYEQLVEDRIAYKGLGGNHEGDRLFDLVEAKMKSEVQK